TEFRVLEVGSHRERCLHLRACLRRVKGFACCQSHLDSSLVELHHRSSVREPRQGSSVRIKNQGMCSSLCVGGTCDRHVDVSLQDHTLRPIGTVRDHAIGVQLRLQC